MSIGNPNDPLAAVTRNPLQGPQSAPLPSTCQPLSCDTAMRCIDGARNPSTSPLEMTQLRGELSDCAPCLNAFDVELQLRTTMTPTMSELPSVDLRARITNTLASVDLSQLDITDFG